MKIQQILHLLTGNKMLNIHQDFQKWKNIQQPQTLVDVRSQELASLSIYFKASAVITVKP